MYSGFVLPRKAIGKIGIHQRLDTSAYRMIKSYLPKGAMPPIKDIIHFEGVNGPDGLKIKSPGVNEPSHLYNPMDDTGEVPGHITGHFELMVDALKRQDSVRAAFEASWLAHYVCDGLTPAHHWPLDLKLTEAAEMVPQAVRDGDTTKFVAELKKNWAVYGSKGHLSTHVYFEVGIAFALLVLPLRPEFGRSDLDEARGLGYLEYFKREAREIAELELYERFYEKGWTADVASPIKKVVAPVTARTIGIIWLMAVEAAGYELKHGLSAIKK